jgi:hypothetical protein
LTDYEVVNFGVSGYGTLHSIIQFRDRLDRGEQPKIAIVAYAGFHDFRNTFTRRRRKSVASFNTLGPLNQPRARLDGSGRLTYAMAEVQYVPFPLMARSALIHYMERKFNNLEAKFHRSNEVSRAILSEFAALAEENQIKMVVAGIADSKETKETLKWARGNGIAAFDISVDLNEEGHRHSHDEHPSELANRKYAEKLERFLRDELLL